ncbi:golgin subfamily A member 6-like protein 22 [Fundulus heteroclitus]|uniref:golgin subfamily A member 6-like protein 22 n=1 Tax=Fundulus heteroclitus TaxID=8078 RepID=UPI00165BD100|nr:golgin subfamily A member 6-like protein 22 [Fundulus heteroclitus]
MADILCLTKRQVSNMSRAELISLLFSWISKKKERYIMKGMKSEVRDRIEHEQIYRQNQENEELSSELIKVKKQLEDVQTRNIAQLKQKTEQQNQIKEELSLQVKQYKNQVSELQNRLREVEKSSKQRLDKVLAEKKRALSQVLIYKEKAEIAQARKKKLKLEFVQKNNELYAKNEELLKEKEKVNSLDAKIYKQQKQIKEMEEQIMNLEKKIRRSNKEADLDKTKKEFAARVELTSGVLVDAREEKDILVRRLLKKDKQVNELLQRQAQAKEPVVVVKKSFEEANYKWTIKELRESNKALHAQVKVCSEVRQRDQDRIEELTDAVTRLKKLYFSEKIKYEDLKESLESHGIRLDAGGVVAHRQGSASETQIPKEKHTFLPPIVDIPVPKGESSPFPVEENAVQGKPKSRSAGTAENLTKQRWPAPPASRKPQTASASEKNIFFLTETDDQAAEKQPRRNHTATPNLRIKRIP